MTRLIRTLSCWLALSACGGEGDEAKPVDPSRGADARVEADGGQLDARSLRSDAGSGDAGARDDASTNLDAGRGDAYAPPQTTVLRETIVVRAGERYDGQGGRFIAGPELGDGSQSEDQSPLFELEPGASLRGVVLGAPAADGIHTFGDATLENIVWEDIGEDALTIKQRGTVVLRGGSAENGDDKVFQINAESTFRVYDFRARGAGKFIRQNGGTGFKVDVHIERCDISMMDEAIFRTDSERSTITMIDTRYSDIGDELFMGVQPGNITQQNNVEY